MQRLRSEYLPTLRTSASLDSLALPMQNVAPNGSPASSAYEPNLFCKLDSTFLVGALVRASLHPCVEKSAGPRIPIFRQDCSMSEANKEAGRARERKREAGKKTQIDPITYTDSHMRQRTGRRTDRPTDSERARQCERLTISRMISTCLRYLNLCIVASCYTID